MGKIGVLYDSATVFEKELPQVGSFEKYAHEQIGSGLGKGCYWDEHELERDGTRLQYPDWEWAEWVGGTLVYAERGCPRRTHPGSDKITLIHDFNRAQFERRVAPY